MERRVHRARVRAKRATGGATVLRRRRATEGVRRLQASTARLALLIRLVAPVQLLIIVRGAWLLRLLALHQDIGALRAPDTITHMLVMPDTTATAGTITLPVALVHAPGRLGDTVQRPPQAIMAARVQREASAQAGVRRPSRARLEATGAACACVYGAGLMRAAACDAQSISQVPVR